MSEGSGPRGVEGTATFQIGSVWLKFKKISLNITTQRRKKDFALSANHAFTIPHITLTLHQTCVIALH